MNPFSHEESLPDRPAPLVVSTIPLVMRILAAEFRRTGHLPMPAQFGVLFTLRQREACNVSELAEHLSVTAPTMSSLLSRMVERGWLVRTRSETDRRQVLLSLTPAGRTMVDQIHQQAVDHVARILEPLSPEDRAALQRGLEIMSDVFTAADSA
jgi:DNA-binding MarR family transcriptional regulator